VSLSIDPFGSPPAWPRAPGLWQCQHRDWRDADPEEDRQWPNSKPTSKRRPPRRAAQPRHDALGPDPYWAKDIKVGFANINAKAERIEKKPAFGKVFLARLRMAHKGRLRRFGEGPVNAGQHRQPSPSGARFRVHRPALTRQSADIVATAVDDLIGHRLSVLGDCRLLSPAEPEFLPTTVPKLKVPGEAPATWAGELHEALAGV
jgi:hypothetical protein